MTYNVSRGKPLLTDGVGIDASALPPVEAGRIDPRAWFGADAPTPRAFHIEIGSGKGTFLVQEAQALRDVHFLGIESASPFYRYAADRIRRHQLINVRMLRGDAVEFIRFWCADAVVDVIHLYFSDPWPKSRHHKRRVVQDASLIEFHRVLVHSRGGAGGELRLVTDHDELWQWYERHAERNAHLFERAPFTPPASVQPGEVVGTNYERKFAVEGRTIRAMTLRKR